MTLVPSTLGQLIQTQLGVNELASAVVVGKAVGSLITRQSDASFFLPLQRKYGLFVRDIPKYLQSITFDRSGTILGDRQRRIPVENTLEGVKLDSVEGIATFMVLILRHVESPADIVDYLEDMLKGEFRLVGRARSDEASKDTVTARTRALLIPFARTSSWPRAREQAASYPSQGAAMIALAAAANGARIRVLCMTHDKGTVVLPESDDRSHRECKA
ncbi:hypothetical protein L207DRAFT_572434 [Hyaloscypha variabilis F]|uniref:Uncharacterized protein n=1 Tax=Hyaloscypha variabilis (strain UAMH 11265 / GT02V1 / F) TaxID=1149755 RepID=A0A2J6R0Y9_HYAVF|nr:hypothetical protein L207DRAFT_572434 [Hyaloscypha variabilis F]